jgi:hypothetical protein
MTIGGHMTEPRSLFHNACACKCEPDSFHSREG